MCIPKKREREREKKREREIVISHHHTERKENLLFVIYTHTQGNLKQTEEVSVYY